MHQQRSKKILIYFFLLLLVGSINNTDLSSLRFKVVKDIYLTGLGKEDNLILLKEIKNLNLGNIFSINKEEIAYKINSNSLVEKFKIFKKYPSSLDIDIQKTKFLARINNTGKIFLLGSNGKFSENSSSIDKLPFIFGKPDIYTFLNFKNIIDQSKFSYDEIKSLYYFPSKRWDLELKNNVLVKLSKNNTNESLDLVFDFLYNNDFKKIQIIDARIKNQIILND